jgi:PiT family inorganic phosphate transporter
MIPVSTATLVTRPAIRPKFDTRPHPSMSIAFVAFLVAGVLFTAYSLYSDIESKAVHPTTWLPFLFLALALFIALGFEFVNGFHDTANAVATVIYTNSLPPLPAVIWSGFCNFLGVMVSSGAVAFGIIALLPVELILQVGSGAGFAMVFALLIAAIIWNLGTWYLGLPVSSSHTLIGSIIGVGIANELTGAKGATSGVDWQQAMHVGESLLFSPFIGFACAALLLLALKFLVRKPSLYAEPHGDAPPPPWIRAVLVLTCTGVSFAHGSNDGQKGMGLIMLILIGIVPTAYALNRAMDPSLVDSFRVVAADAERVLTAHSGGVAAPSNPRDVVGAYLRDRQMSPDTMPALAALSADIARQVREHGSLDAVPAQSVQNVRNDMYLAGEALRHIAGDRAWLRHHGAGLPRRVRGFSRRGHQIHPPLGQDRRRHSAWSRHHGRLAADCGHGGRADRQAAFDLRPGCLCRSGRHGNDRCRRLLRSAGVDDSGAVLGCGRHHGR